MPDNYSFEFEKVPYNDGIFVSVLGADYIREGEFDTTEATFYKKNGDGFVKIGLVRYRVEDQFRLKDELLEMAMSYCESALEAINNCVLHTFDEGDIYVEEIRVCDEYQGHGFGRMILEWLTSISDVGNTIFLTVEYSSDSLFSFYENNMAGYIVEGVVERTMTFSRQ